MKKKSVLLFFGVIFLFGFSQHALADYTAPDGYNYPGYQSPPDFSGDPSYTHQSWDFFDDDGKKPTIPFEPDAYDHAEPWINPYGTPLIIETKLINSAMPMVKAWQWDKIGRMMSSDIYYGMYGGMGTGSVTFAIPNTSGKKEAWVQYIVYIGYKHGPEYMLSRFFADPDLTIPNGTMKDRSWTKLDGPGKEFGEWWRITEVWEIEAGSDIDYLYLETPSGLATMFDAVDVDTRSK